MPNPLTLRHYFAMLIPYAAVIIGEYAFRQIWIAALLYHLGIILVLCIERPPPGVLVTGWNRSWGLFAIMLCIAAGPLVYFLWPCLHHPAFELGPWLAANGISTASWWLFVLYSCTINPALEEFFWRGYLGDPARGLRPVDMFFAGYHVIALAPMLRWPWLIVVFLSLTSAACFWRWMRNRYDGLAIPILSHALADASILGCVMLLLR
jgi:membrane protease YdiL (CAAX protease family)